MQNKPRPNYKRRGIYLLPNAFTTAAMFAGFYAVVAAMSGFFEKASVAIFIAMILDGIDGRVARLTNSQSEFGAEYDSLSDMVSFGLAPALVVYEWALHSLIDAGWYWGKLGWLAAFIYAATAAMRLARFNTQIGVADKRYFQGLPSPSAAAVLAGMVWVCFDMGIKGEDVAIPAMIITVLTGLLMISNILYYSFKEVNFRDRVPYFSLLIIILLLVLATIDTPKVLFGSFLIYVLSGPLFALFRKLRKFSRRRTG